MSGRPSRRDLLRGFGAAALVGLGCGKARTLRAVHGTYGAVATKDGAGVALRRALGSQALRQLDPFLLLDEFKSDDPDAYIKGFPDHPHRGFETVTVMLRGQMEHRDSAGNHGVLGPGSVQWMTAGRGIVHSEMPGQRDGAMWGFQLWVNLPARSKMIRPRYQDLGQERIPEADLGDARARVLAGRAGNITGPVEGVVVAPTLLDVTVPEKGRLRLDGLPPTHTVIAYVTEGAARFGDEINATEAGNLAILGPGDTITAEGASRMLIVAGAPIGEPIARRGPFVMNTEAEIAQAYEDYRSGRLVGG